MNRRRYLAAASAMLGLAGCSSSSSTETTTASPTPTPTATATATEASTETKTSTETATQSDTETSTETANQGSNAEQYVEEAISSTDDAVQVVLGYGPAMNAQFSKSVTASTTEFDDGELLTAVKTAKEAVSEARSYETTSTQKQTLDDLDAFLTWLELYRATMAGTIECYRYIRNALGRYLQEYDAEAARSSIGQVETDLRLTRADYNALESAEANLTSGATDSLSNINAEGVEVTMNRLNQELNATAVFDSQLPRIISGEEAYSTGIEAYRKERFSAAEDDFITARDELNEAESAISDAPKPSAYAGEFGKLSCLTTHLSDAAEAGRKAAVYADVGDKERQQTAEESNGEAIEEFRDCDLDMTERPDYY